MPYIGRGGAPPPPRRHTAGLPEDEEDGAGVGVATTVLSAAPLAAFASPTSAEDDEEDLDPDVEVVDFTRTPPPSVAQERCKMRRIVLNTVFFVKYSYDSF